MGSATAAFGLWVMGIFAGFPDVNQDCASRGQTFDSRLYNRRPVLRGIFPLSKPCNAAYNLIPPWLNPAIVLLVLLAIGAGLAALVLTVQRIEAYLARRRVRPGG